MEMIFVPIWIAIVASLFYVAFWLIKGLFRIK